MTNIAINGSRFLVNNAGVTDAVTVTLADTEGGSPSYQFTVYRPEMVDFPGNAGTVVINDWTDTLIDFDHAIEVGKFVTQVDLVTDPNNTGTITATLDVTPDQPQAGPNHFPLLESICSPAANTIRFVGQRFLTADAGPVGTVVPRLASYAAGNPLNSPYYEFIDGDPDVNGWELVTHTDTVIEIMNPAFTSQEPLSGPGDFIVTGADFHDTTFAGYYFYAPWGDTFSTPVDGSGCVAPEILTYDALTDELTITDVGGNFTADVDFVALWSYDYPIDVWAPDVVYDSPTQVRVLNMASQGFDDDGTPVSHYIHHVAVAEDAGTNYPNTVVFEADVSFNEFWNDNYPVVTFATSDGNDRLLIDGTRFLTGGTEVLNQIQVISDTGPNIWYYDPAGPDAALNPVGATIHQWSNVGIVIEDPGLSGYELGVLGNIHGADLRGRLRLYGGTAGTPVEVGRFVPHPHFTIA